MKKMQDPLSTEMYQRLRDAWTAARTKGFDPFEEQNRRRLILTPEIELEITLSALQKLWDELDNIQPWELLVRQNKDTGGGTPNDMYRAILTYITEYRDYVKENG